MNRNISVIKDCDNKKIIVINDIIFKGKQINWAEVKRYLKQYVGDFYSIAEDNEIIYIGTDLPGEYAGSVYTKSLKGANAKAKANAVQVLPEMIEIASNSDCGELERYNIFKARLLIRHAASGKKYLYDILEIKKETSKSCQA